LANKAGKLRQKYFERNEEKHRAQRTVGIGTSSLGD